VVGWEDFDTRADFSAAIGRELDIAGAEGVVLAGFMRVLAPELVGRLQNRILNIHPSLLPAFPGSNAVAQALQHGAKVTGVTVHFVDEHVDHGPIIAQRAVPILPDDDLESLHARIQIEEHDLYPKVVRAFARGEIMVEGRTVRWA
jgi:phosphoribosylglycinamide formyltransferase-1